jgi:hypothetical protein
MNRGTETNDFEYFESSQQPHRQFAGVVLRMGWFNRGSIPHVGSEPTPGKERGGNSAHGPGQQDQRANATRRQLCENAQALFRCRTVVFCLGLQI